MTKDEAHAAMIAGHKVANQHFATGEYLFARVTGTIMSEDGYNFNDWFFNVRDGEEWKLDGWRIWDEV